MLLKVRSVTILLLVVFSFLCGYSMEGNAMIKGYYCEITDSKVRIAAGEGRSISDKKIIELKAAIADTNRIIHCANVDFSSREMQPILTVLIESGFKKLSLLSYKNNSLWMTSHTNNLDFSDCCLRYEDMKAIAIILKDNTAFIKLNLSKHKIGDEGAKELAAALENNTTLTIIDLGYNDIGSAGGKALVAVLAKNKTLASLNLNCNHIGLEGVKAIAAALAENTTLTELDISKNHIGAAGAMALAKALAKNTILNYLDISNNHIDSEGGKELAAALATNTTLTELDISENHIGAAEKDMIEEILARNELIAPIREKLKQAFFSRGLFIKAFLGFLGKDAEILLPDNILNEIIEKGEAEFFYNLLMFAGEKFFAKAVKAGLLTKDDCEKINEIREFEAERIQSFSPSAPSATASDSSSTVEKNSLYIPKQLNINKILNYADTLAQEEAKPAIPGSSSSASTSASASSLISDTFNERAIRLTKTLTLTKPRDELLEAKEKFLKNISARYIAGIRNADQEQGDVLWGGDLELGRIANILHLRITVHRYAYNTDAPAPARGGIRPGRIIETTVITPEYYTDAIDLWYDGSHYNSANENGEMIFGHVPGDGNCLFHAVIRAAETSYDSSLEQVSDLRNRVADALQNEVDTILPHQQLTENPIVARFNNIITAENINVFREALAALPIGRLRNEAEELHFRLQDAEISYKNS